MQQSNCVISSVDTNDSGANYPTSLIPIDDLLRSEEHCPATATALAARIEQAGTWTTPILVEDTLLFVMDGHHRLAAARQLGLDSLPCVLLAYNDPRLELSAWDPEATVLPDDVVNAALTGNLLPQKTTRHRLSPEPARIVIPLASLRR
ncbi:ParB N-terminal domain-containing protein [Trinickia mobilis]|uniref:ParB N-terminal domain-containing protein n=1 Tax=Trinickia mobilis TaxID=2816356 RepID=UPI001A8EBF62|nr:ParB N-terminal domain-containing protein [Trinickia mobilis]